MGTAIEAGREKYRSKVDIMQRNWESFQKGITSAKIYVDGLVRAGLTKVADAISTAWYNGVTATSALNKYKAKVTRETADKWFSNYTSKMETGSKAGR